MSKYFQIKNPNWTITPPQEGRNKFKNPKTSEVSNYRQAIYDIPPVPIRTDYLNWTFLSLYLLKTAVGVETVPTYGTTFVGIANSPFEDTILSDITGDGQITSTDAITSLKMSVGLFRNSRTAAWARALGEAYEEIKDLEVDGVKLFTRKPVLDFDFDEENFYVIADTSEPETDVLKLVKYKPSSVFSPGYWYDTLNGGRTKFDSISRPGGRVNKEAGSSILEATVHVFNGSTDINTTTNEIYLPDHSLKVGYELWYSPPNKHNFDGEADVNVANKTITITAHGYNSGDIVIYRNEGRGNRDVPPTGLIDGVQYLIEKVDDDTIKLRHIISISAGVNQYAVEALGLGKSHTLSDAFPAGWPEMNTGDSKQVNLKEKVEVATVNGDYITITGGNFTGTATLDNHLLSSADLSDYKVGQKILAVDFHDIISTQINYTTNVITGDTSNFKLGEARTLERGDDLGLVGIDGYDVLTPPQGLNYGTEYYIIPLTTNTYKLAETLEDALNGNGISITNTLGGNVWFAKLTLEVGGTVTKAGDKTTLSLDVANDASFEDKEIGIPNLDVDNINDIALAAIKKIGYRTSIFGPHFEFNLVDGIGGSGSTGGIIVPDSRLTINATNTSSDYYDGLEVTVERDAGVTPIDYIDDSGNAGVLPASQSYTVVVNSNRIALRDEFDNIFYPQPGTDSTAKARLLVGKGSSDVGKYIRVSMENGGIDQVGTNDYIKITDPGGSSNNTWHEQKITDAFTGGTDNFKVSLNDLEDDERPLSSYFATLFKVILDPLAPTEDTVLQDDRDPKLSATLKTDGNSIDGAIIAENATVTNPYGIGNSVAYGWENSVDGWTCATFGGGATIASGANVNATFGWGHNIVSGERNIAAGGNNKLTNSYDTMLFGNENEVHTSNQNILAGKQNYNFQSDSATSLGLRNTLFNANRSLVSGTYDDSNGDVVESVTAWSATPQEKVNFINLVQSDDCIMVGKGNSTGTAAIRSAIFGYQNRVGILRKQAGASRWDDGFRYPYSASNASDMDYNAYNSLVSGASNTVAGQGTVCGGKQNIIEQNDFGVCFGYLNRLPVGSEGGNFHSNMAFGTSLQTPTTTGGVAEGMGQVVVGAYNDHDSWGQALRDEGWSIGRQNFSVGTGSTSNNKHTSFIVGPRLTDTGKDFSGIAMPRLAETTSYSNDSQAADGGVPIGGIYHHSGVLMIRRS